MIGQDRIIENINMGNIPNPLLLVGEEGMGKHTIVDKIIEKFPKSRIDIVEKFTSDDIQDLYLQTESQYVIIDFNKIGLNKRINNVQNSLLKLIEEPPKNIHIIILVQSLNEVLDTIKNRCQVWTLKDYTVEELRAINNNLSTLEDYKIKYFIKTPKNAIEYKNDNEINSLTNLCDTIARMIGAANVSNTLSIVNKLDVKGEDSNKLSLNLFFNVLIYTLYKYSLDGDKYFKAFMLVQEAKSNLKVLGVDKVALLENLLIRLKQLL